MPADESESLLQDARRGAVRVLETLLQQHRELGDPTTAGTLTSEQLADGQRAVAQAIDAARRTLEQIEADLRAASTSD